MASVGYSGMPLAKKLGLKPEMKILALNAPKDYRTWLAPLPAGVSVVSKPSRDGAALVHLFAATASELDKGLPIARRAMTKDGALWISWYKKSAKIPTDVSEDMTRARALETDLVDVKVCAVSDVWSGLKLVVRKHLR